MRAMNVRRHRVMRVAAGIDGQKRQLRAHGGVTSSRAVPKPTQPCEPKARLPLKNARIRSGVGKKHQSRIGAEMSVAESPVKHPRI